MSTMSDVLRLRVAQAMGEDAIIEPPPKASRKRGQIKMLESGRLIFIMDDGTYAELPIKVRSVDMSGLQRRITGANDYYSNSRSTCVDMTVEVEGFYV